MLIDFAVPVQGQHRYRCMRLETDGSVRFNDYYEDELVRVPGAEPQ